MSGNDAQASAGFVSRTSATVDRLIGVEGTLGYFFIFFIFVGGYFYLKVDHQQAAKSTLATESKGEEGQEENKEPPRNFTLAQLRKFDGTEDKPLYLSVNRNVFDVSAAKEFYGPGGPYEVFAGRECGVALAKMSFDDTHLDDLAGCEKLTAGEKYELENWIDKFTNYRGYPLVGKLVRADMIPSSDRVVTKEELAKHDGSGTVPPDYAVAPIYVGAGEKVFDVSFGGVSFYGPGCSYNRFAGKDASRALAKMSFEPENIENADISDLTGKERKILDDWIARFEEEKLYPCVGKIAR